jgi:preprotein translocase subunit SecE
LYKNEEVHLPVGAFFSELLHVGIYKRSQGRITRQVTFASLMVALALGLMRLSSTLAGKGLEYQFVVPGLLLLVCAWATYRLVNVPAFADFLIAVEAEMNKVSWPTRAELIRASMVVLLMMFALAFYLGGCDVLWSVVLKWGLGI